ncbi:YihY/virulence factor BrkB family protein [Consotaella salsifontis]|uniref:Membrane protein n=1 Tax=Consotaella salsifontis TaxID=1365950 RepID=A0A1T4T301_9HYPH|nr:YihY/virulence factor BrkB family protein [Consotaella salsifontis]SKA34865.1 membrane protein [Consotaella salsifontis]
MSVRFAPDTTEETRRRASEPGRGRDAGSPAAIPLKGWKDIIARIARSFFRDRVMLIAAGATFYLLLAIFPAVGVFVSLYGMVADPTTIAGHIAFFNSVLPPAGADLIQSQLQRLTTETGTSLSIGFIGGLLFSLWSANNGIMTLFEAMNVAYGEIEKRGFLKLYGMGFAFTLGAFCIGTLLLVTVGLVPMILSVFGLSGVADRLIDLSRWPIVFLLLVGAIAFVYRFGPSRTRARWSWVIFGAMLTAIAWLVMSVAFSWYLQHIANYNRTYGPLGAVIGFMMWVWISSLIFIIGAEVNAEMEHQTALDTTDRPEKPLGKRGARVADTIGESTAKTRTPHLEKSGFLHRRWRKG